MYEYPIYRLCILSQPWQSCMESNRFLGSIHADFQISKFPQLDSRARLFDIGLRSNKIHFQVQNASLGKLLTLNEKNAPKYIHFSKQLRYRLYNFFNFISIFNHLNLFKQ